MCFVAFIQVTHACLAGKERLEAFPLQVIQQGDGRDVRVTFAAGFMFSSLKTLGTCAPVHRGLMGGRGARGWQRQNGWLSAWKFPF
jgi:hypothetical protein